MRRPVILLLVLVIVLGVGVFALIQLGLLNIGGTPTNGGGGQQVVQGTPTPTDTPIVLQQLVIAVQELPRGIRIPPEGALAVVHWPIQTVPNNAISDPKE